VTAQPLLPVIPSSSAAADRRRSRAATGRAMPLARPVRSLPEGVVYGAARIDASGRIGERAVIAALGWAGGDRLTATAEEGVVVARRDPGGMVTLPASGGPGSGHLYGGRCSVPEDDAKSYARLLK
jgi:hypothetical protein